MTDDMISTAGSVSKDPAQQHLRQQKAIWNQSVKSLISKLIAFKRGINGRGDPKAGIPASKIEYPFPSEIGSYLDQIATEYSAIVEGASSIIAEQQHYSEVRRKPQEHSPETSPSAPMAADDGLVSEASWLGSRMWANLFGIRGKGRKHVVSMLDKANEISKTLEDLENILTSSNPNSISSAVNEAGSLGFSTIKLFIEQSKALNKLAPETRPTPKPEESGSDKPNSEQVQQPEESPAAPQQEEAPYEIIGHGGTEDLRRTFFDCMNIYQMLSKDIIQANAPVELAKTRLAGGVNPESEQTLTESNLSQLGYAAAFAIRNAKKIDTDDAYRTAIDVLTKLIESYRNISAICAYALQVQMPPDAVASYTCFKYMNSILAKTKTAGVKSYLKKKWMKFVNTIVSDKTDSVKLQCLEQIVTALDKTNILMNTLETPGSQPDKIRSDSFLMFQSLYKIYATIIILAELHNTEREQELINKKRKDVNLFEVKEKSIARLKGTMRMIEDFVQS